MEINKELKIEVVKSFSVSADKLYQAWTSPGQLKQWWKPMGNSLTEVVNDLKVGGAVKYIFDNNKLNITGEYLEVNENEKLVYTWNWDFPNDAVKNAAYKLTVSFKSADGGSSEINVLQENFQDEETLLPHHEGWEKGLTDLNNFLSNNTASSQTGSGQEQTEAEKAEGYREDPAQVKVGGG